MHTNSINCVVVRHTNYLNAIGIKKLKCYFHNTFQFNGNIFRWDF